MSAPRKLSPAEEAAIMSWYSEYQKALNEVRKLGSVKQMARKYQVRTETIHAIAKRDEYSLRRKCREAGVSTDKAARSA